MAQHVTLIVVVVIVSPPGFAHLDDRRGGFVDQVPNEAGHEGQRAHDAVRVGGSDRLGPNALGNLLQIVVRRSLLAVLDCKKGGNG